LYVFPDFRDEEGDIARYLVTQNVFGGLGLGIEDDGYSRVQKTH
jgi:hypothetical protein